jgi:chromate transporter
LQHPGPAAPGDPARRLQEVFLAFLKLGFTAFGGPVAHLGYFREEFVVRRRWLDAHAFADLVSLCQFLPGPASSQVGFALGLMRAGYRGALAAWVGFTLPSAALLLGFAAIAGQISGVIGTSLLHGLKLAAVAIVAQAVWLMARSLCPDWPRALLAGCAAIILLWIHSPLAQVGMIAGAGLLGTQLHRVGVVPPLAGHLSVRVSRRAGLSCLAAFALLLVGLPLLKIVAPSPALALLDAFYRAGALVFGGGHVVLPLLNEGFVSSGWVSNDAFLAGYGAAQAVPGPLFTFAAYLGFLASPASNPVLGAVLGLGGIFLPGFLLLVGALPLWDTLRKHPDARGALAGVNAAVVGLLGAALYSPVWTGAVSNWLDSLLAPAGFLLLTWRRMPPLLVVGVMACGALILRSV